MKKKLNLLIAGPLPPPAGGISIHIRRLSQLIEADFHLDFIDEASEVKEGYFNIRRFNPITYFGKIAKADALFIHSGSKLLKKLHILCGRLMGKKVIITLHGYGKKRNFFFRQWDALFFRMPHRIVLVNPGIIDKVPLPTEKCIVKHAFIPPAMNAEPVLPQLLNDWIKKGREQDQWIICANASRLDLHKNEDLYGLDLCLEACRRLVAGAKPVRFVFVVSALDAGEALFDKGKKIIAANNLSEHFLLLHEKISFARLIENSDIVLRPTNTDGDALTIREALFLQKTIIASDVVERPLGTVLFKTRDVNDLVSKIETVLAQKNNTGQDTVTNTPGTEGFRQFYVDLVQQLFNQQHAVAMA